MINKITNYLQYVIDTGTIGLALCVAAWFSFAKALGMQQHAPMALTALFVALAGLSGLNLLKIVIKAFERGEDA